MNTDQPSSSSNTASAIEINKTQQTSSTGGYLFEMNLINLGYLAFRLSPFILVCFFTLQSFLNWDLKGIVYLAGLLLTAFVVVMSDSLVPTSNTSSSNECNIITLGAQRRKLPLSTVVFSYTFLYLVTLIVNTARNANTSGLDANNFQLKNLSNAMTANMPTMILFPLLLIIDSVWITSYNCFNITQLFIAFILGSLGGLIWATVIMYSNNPDLLYITGNGSDTCSRPRTNLFRCRIKG